ncbi:allergen-like protein [Perilla frutescens var. frutescens]|nr:allergen-like protein [Perilla frutescens var. frutescens]
MESCVNIIGRRFKEFCLAMILFFIFICFYATYISSHNPQTLSESMRLWTIEAGNISFKELKINNNVIMIVNGMKLSIVGTRRLLGGPGSSPPRCTWKCGGCTPCKPVHVEVQPGTPVTTEYYPEAWRCKCGNNLYMP